MLILFVDIMKVFLFFGLMVSIWNLCLTRLLMPKIFWLIALFVQLSFILLLHGIEFISFVVLLLYVGAISVLFLFVVMILNPDVKFGLENLSSDTSSLLWFKSYSLLTTTLVTFFFSLLLAEAFILEHFSYLQGLWANTTEFLVNYRFLNPFVKSDMINNYGWGSVPFNGISGFSDIWVITESLYSKDFVAFWIVGFILLVAMVGAILLTLQKSEHLKRQKITTQNKRYYSYNR